MTPDIVPKMIMCHTNVEEKRLRADKNGMRSDDYVMLYSTCHAFTVTERLFPACAAKRARLTSTMGI